MVSIFTLSFPNGLHVFVNLYRIIDPGHGAPVIASDIDYAGYKEGMDNLRRIMPIVGFNNQVS